MNLIRTLILLLLSTAPASAASVWENCQTLAKGHKGHTQTCANHVKFYEVVSATIDACTAFSEDVDVRLRCLKSGANSEIVSLCRGAGWSVDGTLTCMRSYPTKDTLRDCKRLGPNEEEQIRCVRIGRESAQILGCTEMMPDPASRLFCLQMDVPSFEARRCGVAHKRTRDRIECLEDYVARREGDYQQDQKELRTRTLASEPAKVEPIHVWTPGKLKK